MSTAKQPMSVAVEVPGLGSAPAYAAACAKRGANKPKFTLHDTVCVYATFGPAEYRDAVLRMRDGEHDEYSPLWDDAVDGIKHACARAQRMERALLAAHARACARAFPPSRVLPAGLRRAEYEAMFPMPNAGETALVYAGRVLGYTRNVTYAGIDDDVAKADWLLAVVNAAYAAARGNVPLRNPMADFVWNVVRNTLGARDKTLDAAHVGAVPAVDWSGDGTRLVSAGNDGAVRVWDAASGVLRHDVVAHVGGARCVAWSPDSTQVVSGGRDLAVRVWDVASDTLLRTLVGHTDIVNAVAWSRNAQWLASNSRDATTCVWDAASGALLHTLASHGEWSSSLSWSPVEPHGRLAAAVVDGVWLWDATSGALTRVFMQPQQSANICVDWSPDGAQLVAGTANGRLYLWAVATGVLLRTIVTPSGLILGMAWSPTGARIATGHTGGTMHVWNAATGEHLRTLMGHSAVFSVSWSPDGEQLASSSWDGTLRVWHM